MKKKVIISATTLKGIGKYIAGYYKGYIELITTDNTNYSIIANGDDITATKVVFRKNKYHFEIK